MRKSGDNNEVIRFSNFAGSRVVLFDRFEFTAKIRLEDALHMFGDFLQSITDLSRVCPDSIADQQLIEVRQVHQSGKALAKPHRINQCELNSAGSDMSQESQQDGTDEFKSRFATGSVVFDKD